ncbi:hypothetical protein EV356DRAFT_507793 [Viridothelium virens]|uniref:CCCH zinc finger and RRM domain-containing protein n=1 Tax=Viridothelium virens TaxID=1048519 RepID=A0A6A6GZ59_VIRVR|nr:hypothetical protein EV356DRAFT_507793 [Viridothelium virens]
MKLDDAEAKLLKEWAKEKLEVISDADPDVLSDYVLALFRSQEDDSRVRESSLEQLEDFLGEHTTQFVDDVFFAVRNKTYLPDYKPPPQTQPPSTATPFHPPSGPTTASATSKASGAPNGNRSDHSRKRGYIDRDAVDGRDPHYGRGVGGERGLKQMRRGNRAHHTSGRAARPQDINLGLHLQVPNVPAMPTPPAGFPPLDPNNPLAAIMAMQALGMPPLPPNMPQLPHAGSPTYFQQPSPVFSPPGSQGSPSNNMRRSSKVRQRCLDYDTRGYCAMGSQCPYEHGQDHIPVSGQEQEEYDPANAAMNLDNPKSSNGNAESDYNRNSNRGFRGRESRGRGDRGRMNGSRGYKRADFSHAGPNHDKSNTTIVVEQIPEENFSEEAVRGFFSEFGSIEEVTMQAYRHLAIVRFSDYESAKRAWDSPKVIFDNRFVKVFWYKPDSLQKSPISGHPSGKSRGENDAMEGVEETAYDPVEFARKQEEAQKAFEEKQKALSEAASKREELDAKLKAQAEERKKLYERLVAKAGNGSTKAVSPGIGADGGSNVAPISAGTNGEIADETTTNQTNSLRAKLAELEAEAESMGISSDDAWQQGYAPRGRGFSPYRGRGRGREYDPSRAGYAGLRGRGGFAPRGGAVKRLDNRPRNVAVAVPAQEWDGEKDEALRQYLIFSGTEFESLEPHPDRQDAHIVVFKERWLAEKFFTSTTSIPHIGAVELSWVPNTQISTTAATSSVPLPSAKRTAGPDSDTTMSEDPVANLRGGTDVAESNDGAELVIGEGIDYDVADGDDRWMD